MSTPPAPPGGGCDPLLPLAGAATADAAAADAATSPPDDYIPDGEFALTTGPPPARDQFTVYPFMSHAEVKQVAVRCAARVAEGNASFARSVEAQRKLKRWAVDEARDALILQAPPNEAAADQPSGSGAQRQKIQDADGDGSKICQHNRQRSRCEE